MDISAVHDSTWSRVLPRCPFCVQSVNTSPDWQVPVCTQCYQHVHFDMDPDQFQVCSMAVMLGTHTRLGRASLIDELSDGLLHNICSMTATHDLGCKGVWGMCCVKIACQVWYDGAVREIDTGHFVCHCCVKKDFLRISTDPSNSPSNDDPLHEVASRM